MTELFPIDTVRSFSNRVFMAAGLADEDAEIVTDVLIHADLRGHASHGVTRIPIYSQRIKAGVVNAHPSVMITRTAPGFLVVDGDNGPGPVVSLQAIDAAIDAAKETGISIASVGHSNHNGAGSYYVERAIEAGCIAFAMTNAPPSMAVFGGREPVIGTNPIAFGTPAAGDAPVLLDMATALVARGKIVEAAKRGDAIPEGWALDKDGRPTTDAGAAEKGVVLPMAGAKGSALAIMVEVMAGVLAGGRFAGDMGNLYSDWELTQDNAHVFIVIDATRGAAGDRHGERVGELVGMLKKSALAEGHDAILMPGEIEMQRTAAMQAEGIALPPNVLADLDAIAREVGAPPLQATVQA